MQIVTHVLVYRVFNNDCTPFTAKTGKTLAKLLLYYNSLNKVKLVCKVSQCVLLFVEFKKSRITNYKSMWPPAAATTASSLCRNDSSSSANNSLSCSRSWRTVYKFDNKVWCEYLGRAP